MLFRQLQLKSTSTDEDKAGNAPRAITREILVWAAVCVHHTKLLELKTHRYFLHYTKACDGNEEINMLICGVCVSFKQGIVFMLFTMGIIVMVAVVCMYQTTHRSYTFYLGHMWAAVCAHPTHRMLLTVGIIEARQQNHCCLQWGQSFTRGIIV